VMGQALQSVAGRQHRRGEVVHEGRTMTRVSSRAFLPRACRRTSNVAGSENGVTLTKSGGALPRKEAGTVPASARLKTDRALRH
jgi:hypothetical protein